MELKIVNCPSQVRACSHPASPAHHLPHPRAGLSPARHSAQDLALTNCVYVAPGDIGRVGSYLELGERYARLLARLMRLSGLGPCACADRGCRLPLRVTLLLYLAAPLLSAYSMFKLTSAWRRAASA